MNVREEFLPYAQPSLTHRELEEVLEAVRSLWWSRGEKCQRFEEEFAQKVGARYAVSMNSCTAALEVALCAYGVSPGDEVITTPMTFCSTANVALHLGARPIFCDIDPQTGLIDPAGIEPLITDKTRAILPVHYGGQPCDLKEIYAIADKNGLVVIEDAAHAAGAFYHGEPIGNCRDAAAFSFYATKNLATGEGGMLTTNDPEVAEKARVLSLHGMDKNAYNRYQEGGSHLYDVVYPGYKFNMGELAAALGLAQLERLDQMQATRRRYATLYEEGFASIPGIKTLRQLPERENAWHLFVIQVDPREFGMDREGLIRFLTGKKIGTSVHFKPVHTMTYYEEHLPQNPVPLPHAEAFYQTIISLPLYPSMGEEDVQYVIESVREASQLDAK
ncbi:DegT/DnrJ/EryC1/StrS family aminotransferase [Phocea massiliensis]|jgi:dTDP-4-amino-4,6-dideoxygalactose transaminase|uniref:UDP-4-amino-4-deoxy-L-arabinose--oxoglutarate aminotransferase n=1 Tax=uncultured Anaerotruncus sp. TaxID=905011 RepID=A0A6N2RCX4_9FIRM|nr:DegT/DnrJ/EryC1/StrS family aminotransferase [Merdimmobilis hominis]MCD4836621.1 DegT/DnrJ/EryC1/StrS family aminotransferase [Merdimmobilis hominis]